MEGVLERVDGVARFTRYTTFANLTVPSESDTAKARKLLEKAEHLCLISNSLRGQRDLVIEIVSGSRARTPQISAAGKLSVSE